MLEQLVVILQRPQDAVNVGAIVRAMKNMGISHLRLVQPEPLAHDGILRVAHHCEDLLQRMTCHPTLAEALADLHYVVGTAALPHPGRRQTSDIRGLAATLVTHLQAGRVGLLFGQEDDGLDQAALDRCHLLITLPTNPAYPALNLAQAVLLLLYEVRMAVLAGSAPSGSPASPPAQQAALERLFHLSETTLAQIGFFKGNQAAVMRKVRQIAYKAHLTPEEVALLMAMVRQVKRGA
ncbi:MAG: TrmJ/YjtD family RNA methyltransferase [Caldilinea sp. CFX5]|nr:TrmJ/YjtD family RNA methyltransferase [Caldilinea sp. CFX5]